MTVAAVNGGDPSIGSDGRYVTFTSGGNLTGTRPASEEGIGGTTTVYESAIYMRIRNAPTVTAMSPTSLEAARNAQVLTVTGTNFTDPSAPGDLSVSFGTGVSVTSVTWVSSSELQVTVDTAWNTALGARTATVVNPGDDAASLATALTLTEHSTGYQMGASDGGVFAFGSATFSGSMGGKPLNAPVIGISDTNSGNGYWLVASDGGIFSFGDAAFHGSLGGKPLNAPVVGMAAVPTGGGYWESPPTAGSSPSGTPPSPARWETSRSAARSSA